MKVMNTMKDSTIGGTCLMMEILGLLMERIITSYSPRTHENDSVR